MTTQIAKIKNGSVPIPKEWLSEWKGAEVLLRSSGNTMVLKKLEDAPFWNSWNKLKLLGKKINQKDIEKAVRLVRSKK